MNPPVQLTKDQFTDFATKALAAGGIKDPAAIEGQLDQMLAMVPHLREDRQRILDSILATIVTNVGSAEMLVDDAEDVRWINPEVLNTWTHWQWLKAYLADEVKRPTQVLKELDESTTTVIDQIGDPKRPGIWDRRGLVVGHVQSGKTQHYTALAAKAFDAGFKVVIILSGIHENLRQQTQERIEQLIIGKNSRDSFRAFGLRSWVEQRLGAYKIPTYPKVPLPPVSTMTSVAGDYGAQVNRQFHVTPGQESLVLVVKKNASILRNLLNWISGGNADQPEPLRVPALIIDDEADHSSINTADPETDPTTINKLIRQLLWRCDQVGFVGYTATPYANIFMDDVWEEKLPNRDLKSEGSDLFPRSFIQNLDTPTNYIGPDAVFGHEGDESLGIARKAALPMHIKVDDADTWMPPGHKKIHPVTPELPDSLRQAVRAFLLVAAARAAIGQAGEHCSMLVHVSRFNDVQEQVTKHLETEMSALIERIKHGADPEVDWEELRSLWKRIFVHHFDAFANHPSQQLVKPVLPDWPAVKANVLATFERIEFQNINSTTKANLDYSGRKDGLIVVAVGGDRLSRGLTLEGLCISYFLRGAKAFDTLMQMGRWFGYRPGYAHLCRVWAPDGIYKNFRLIALATEELRREFSRMSFLNKRPKDYGLRVREPRADLLVTAMNKMRRGETVRVHFSDSLVSSLEIPVSRLHSNYAAFESLIQTLHGRRPGTRGEALADQTKVVTHFRWDDVPSGEVLEFVRSYRAINNVCFDEVAGSDSMLGKFIEAMNAKGELTTWTVATFQSAESDSAIEGLPYGTVGRTVANESATTVEFRGVAVGTEEAIDLRAPELDVALQRYQQAKAMGMRTSRAAMFRMSRPATRGLLLLYPIRPKSAKPLKFPAQTIIGIAVSLPSSARDEGIDYVCNPQKLRELYGADFYEDTERDETEATESPAAR